MFGFNLEKTIQATAVLLEREPAQRTNYMRLVKLLYIADRESLKERAKPICGSQAYAMERGPVLGTVLDLIKGRDPDSERWSEFIRKDHYCVELVKRPGNFQLSRSEIKKLQEVSDRYQDSDEWDMVVICHQLPEFVKNDPMKTTQKVRPIPLDDILEAVDRLRDKADIIRDANEDIGFSRFFGDHVPTVVE